MDELLKRIYDEILVYEDDIAKENTKADKIISRLITPYIEQVSAEEAEKLDDLLSMAVQIAEQTGFKNGMRFAVKLIVSILK